MSEDTGNDGAGHAPAGAEQHRRVRHKKRGSTYEVIGAGRLQAAAPVVEGMELVIYRCETDGRFWLRPVNEFEDGRFEPLPPL